MLCTTEYTNNCIRGVPWYPTFGFRLSHFNAATFLVYEFYNCLKRSFDSYGKKIMTGRIVLIFALLNEKLSFFGVQKKVICPENQKFVTQRLHILEF